MIQRLGNDGRQVEAGRGTLQLLLTRRRTGKEASPEACSLRNQILFPNVAPVSGRVFASRAVPWARPDGATAAQPRRRGTAVRSNCPSALVDVDGLSVAGDSQEAVRVTCSLACLDTGSGAGHGQLTRQRE